MDDGRKPLQVLVMDRSTSVSGTSKMFCLEAGTRLYVYRSALRRGLVVPGKKKKLRLKVERSGGGAFLVSRKKKGKKRIMLSLASLHGVTLFVVSAPPQVP